ncbi:MAG: hypothetical protein IIB00_10730 [candidate division Zixibacteria bacterium]|nr:hypothetical protein [candidate division Zixibacteria bacterium]
MDGKLMVGVMMLLLGGLMLLDELGVIRDMSGYFAPLALIAVGVSFLFAKNRKCCDNKHDKDNNKERAE